MALGCVHHVLAAGKVPLLLLPWALMTSEASSACLFRVSGLLILPRQDTSMVAKAACEKPMLVHPLA